MNTGSESHSGPSGSQTQIESENILTSQRGKRLLLRAGHKYNEKRRNKDDSTVWICTKRTSCKAKLVTSIDNNIIREDNHSCEPDFTSNEIDVQFEKCINKIKSDYTISVPSVYRDTVAELNDSGVNLIRNIPDFVNIRDKLYRKRNKSLNVTKVCFNSTKYIIVPEKFKDFLLCDYNYKSDRILVFANENFRSILTRPNLTILCDGTFKCCLKPFKQLYTFHVDLGSSETHNNVIPVIYALLPNKTKNIYKTLFCLIKSQIPQFSPKLFVLDFEQSAMSAIQETFPETHISGCYFHFSKSLWHKAEELGLSKLKLARKHIKRCSVLAHLPKENIENGWLYIMSQCPTNANIVPFNDYFVQTWLNENSFYFDKWSCYRMQHRTTNMVESWHSTFNKKMPSNPKSIAQFLSILKKEDDYFNTLYQKGSNITNKHKETQEMDKHIDTTINEYKQGYINIDLCIERLIV